MFRENICYNKIIKSQMQEYLHQQELIQRRVNNILSKCNVHYVIGNEKQREKQLQQLGGADKLFFIGGGGVIFKNKWQKFYNSMMVTSLLKQRNLRLNFYGGLYYELGNYEYCMGLTPLRQILIDMGVKHSISDDDVFTIDKCYNIEPLLFNYVVDLYNHHNSNW